jgi:hypothetical protein
VAACLPLIASDCQGPDRDVTAVPAADESAPVLTLYAFAPAGGGTTTRSVVVSDGDSAELAFTTGTGQLQLNAFARDEEGGVRRVEVWIAMVREECENSRCTRQDMTAGAPTFDSDRPAATAGELVYVDSAAGGYVPLAVPPVVAPGNLFQMTWTVHARASKYCGTQSESPTITIKYTAPVRAPADVNA